MKNLICGLFFLVCVLSSNAQEQDTLNTAQKVCVNMLYYCRHGEVDHLVNLFNQLPDGQTRAETLVDGKDTYELLFASGYLLIKKNRKMVIYFPVSKVPKKEQLEVLCTIDTVVKKCCVVPPESK